MPRDDHRKSSLGARRGPPRQHIPFRADDLARGKKTGVAVAFVDRNSDEFEPFDQLIKQADDRPPPRIKSRKRRVSIAPPVGRRGGGDDDDDDDGDGEMSMELAESNQGSPLAYFTNSNSVYAPDSSRRPFVSRPSLRGYETDYDQLPSPRSRLHPHPSTTNGRASSALSKSFTASAPSPSPEFDYANTDFDPPQQGDTPPRSQSPQTSLVRAEEEDEVAEVELAVSAHSSRVDKGKRRAVSVEEPDEQPIQEPYDGSRFEDDIAQGLEEIENAEGEEDDPPPAKKPRKETAKLKKSRPPKPASKTPVEHSPTPDGVRRGRRHRFKPLDWWRQERVVYGRRDSGMILVPQIKEVIRIPQEPTRPLGKAGKRKRGTGVRAKSKGRDTPFNPEEGWDDDTLTNAIVIDYVTNEEVSRRVAFMANMIEPRPSANSDWLFEKIFGEGEFVAAGQMHIPPKCQKPSKSTKDNTYVFYVIQGAVSVFIHETSFIITTGGMFLVPRGNTYYIENIAERDAKLFFTQARQVPAEIIPAENIPAESIPGESILAESIPAQHTARSAPPSSHRRAISEDVSAAPRKGARKKRQS